MAKSSKSLHSNVQNHVWDESKPISYISLFQFSTGWEKIWIGFAVVLAILSGCIPPVVSILYGEFCNMLVDRQFPTDNPSTTTFLLEWFGGGKILQNASKEEMHLALEQDSIAWGLGCAVFTLIQLVILTISIFILNFTAARQISRIQILFFKSVLCKDMTWFDTKMDGNFVGKTSNNLKQLQLGIGEVIGIFVYLVVIFVCGVVVAFIYGWQLTLAILSTAPISIATSIVVTKSKLAAKELLAYAAAGKVAEEVFFSIRTVVAFEGEEKEVERYSVNLMVAKRNAVKRGLASGISGGILWFIIYSSYAIAFAYGVRLIQESKENDDEAYTPAVLLIVFYGIFTGLTNIGFASVHLETFSLARGAAAAVFHTINTETQINSCSDAGSTPDTCRGEVEFRNVHFHYPSRPETKILRGLNLKIRAGEIVAIVGGSGTGKSTVLQLIQRLYDPSHGEIFIDGQDIRTLNVSWLRQQIGVVGQEPLLFSTSIRENILYGLLSATDEDVVQAAKIANAHDFILREIDGYDTVIGQKGSTLSGGQKQRIAIARALIRSPKILLLDEATSALDAVSEKIVQTALDKAAEGRTTLIVTHRLSTIANVHRIIVLANGVIVEDGTHEELVDAEGIYYELLQSQTENVKEVKREGSNVPPDRLVIDSPVYIPSTPHSQFSSTPSILSNASVGSKPVNERSHKNPKVKWMKIMEWSPKNWGFLITGSVASIVLGAALPVVCVLFGNLFGLLSLTDYQEILSGTDFYTIMLVVVGITAGICVFLQIYCFTVSELALSMMLRLKAFRSMLHQDIGWFDEERNCVGALCLRLSQDAAILQGASGSRIGVLIQALSTIAIGTILSFGFSWKMTLVTLSTIPFVFSGVYMESVFGKRSKRDAEKSMEKASKIAAEVIANIKAVASLGREAFFISRYSETVNEGKRRNLVRAWLRGLAFAIGQTAPFFGYAISLWYGGYLIANEDLHYKYVVMVSELLIFGAWTLGQCVVLAPSFQEAREAASRLEYLFMRKPNVNDGKNTNSPDMDNGGTLVYSKVYFAYPTRPRTPALKNFSCSVREGQSIAVMGHSGSGKSTLIQLLLRYYNPSSGGIDINNVSIREYKLSSLRRILGLVSQEPVLFDRTVEENIAYGNNSRIVPKVEVVEAAKAANIHNFIESLPQGYDTKLGTAGTQLSGGQKQRIAIARALVRNPQVMLLDEATSALDPQSEKIVQEALDKASMGRTTITVAHRLSAVRNADHIYVLDKGSVCEHGTHEDLMERRGVYYSMQAIHGNEVAEGEGSN